MILLLLIILAGPLLADTPSSISSTKAIYDGNALVLRGNVELQHTLGSMVSGVARLEKEEKDSPFSSIFLGDNVHIILKNQAQILCDKADFDFQTLKGTLHSKWEEGVQFSTEGLHPFTLSSESADLTFAKTDGEIQIATIKAKANVEAHYGENFALTAEDLFYSESPTPYVCVNTRALLCHNGDRIEADKVEVFPDAERAILTSPKGNLKPSVFSENQEIEFSCENLAWNDQLHSLSLKGDIWIKDKQLGQILCDNLVELTQKETNGKWTLGEITARGRTQIEYLLDAKSSPLLVCHGKMHLDQSHLLLTLESPEELPIEYYHDEMQLTGEHAVLHYGEHEGKYQPEKLKLTGNILLSTAPEGGAVRLAIADEFAYFPEEDTMLLSCHDGKKVLFFDAEQDLSVSAKEVRISHPSTNPSVKGVGNVKLSFSSTENALLKKLFPFYHPKGGSDESR